MLGEVEVIAASARKVQKAARVLNRAFSVIFWLTLCFTFLMLIAMIAQGIVDFSSSTCVPLFSSCIRFSLEMLVALVMIWILKAMFRDIACGVSPFSQLQAKRLRLTGVLQIAHAVFIAVSSPAVIQVLGFENAAFGVTIGSASAEGAMRFIPVNAGDIVLAVVLFCAALIVEYGSLLQQLSDDTL